MSPDADPDIYDVAIVGYGPVGVVLAALLGQAGLKVYACDRLGGVYDIPRAIALDHEILRIFQQIGVLDAVLPHCEPFTPSEFFGLDGQLIRRMTMLPPPHPQGFTPSMVFSQPPVEQALRERVARLPMVATALGMQLVAIGQDDTGVTLTVRPADGADGERRVRAAFAVACDGGASFVRAQLGVAMEDLDFDEPWLVVDVLVHAASLHKLPRTSVQYCEPDRPCTLVIGPGLHRRWEISLKPGEDPRLAASPEHTWRLLSRWLTPDDGRLWRQASYRFHALVAQHWRVGRVLLAGDAAHMQPPFLGQGMCQGLRDAANLAWKLAEVLQGRVGGDAARMLLDSYGEERKAHVRELTQRIKAVGALVCERDVQRARDRDARLLAQCGGVVRDTPRQDILPRLEAGVHTQLDAGADTPGRGTLFPQPWVQAQPLPLRLDDAAGRGWRLVLSAQAHAWPVPVPAGVARLVVGSCPGPGVDWVEREAVLASWWQRMQAQAALVRPDHYVWGTAATPGQLQALLDGWLQRRTPSAAGEQLPTFLEAS